MKINRVLTLFLVFSLISFEAFANFQNQPTDHPGQIKDDLALVAAVNSRHNQNYIEAGNLVVTRILPDDTHGLPHQKWEARLSNGKTITVVYNSDMGDKVPVEIGKSFGVGGQFIWTGNGGLVHWVHDDPKKRRPDGYVYVDGVVYGDTDHEDNLFTK